MHDRVLLIVSPYLSVPPCAVSKFPLGVMYLSSYLKKFNYDTKIVDCNAEMSDYRNSHSIDEIIDRYFHTKLKEMINKYDPIIIGINVFASENFQNAIHLSSSIKKYSPNIPIVLGGIHPTIFHREILENYDFIDYVIIGEGEISFYNLVEAIRSSNIQRISEIDGIAFRSGTNITVKPKTTFISNLDDLPFPDYDGIDMDKYTSRFTKRLDIITSRSCPFQCNFCSMNLVHGRRWRPRSVNNVVDEIEFLIDRYKINHFSFMDDNLTINKKRTMELFGEIMKRGIQIKFCTINGLSVKTLDKDIIEIMKKAGMYQTCLGIESGSDYIRNEVVGKNLSRDKIYEVVRLCKENKVEIEAFFILGMPGETKDTLNETRKLIKEINPDWLGLFYAVPYAGTRL